MINLQDYGWTPIHEAHHNKDKQPNLLPGRVVSIQGFKYHLITPGGECEAELSGKLIYGTEPEDLPVVGDWVHFTDYGEAGLIVSVFPRQNFLSRKKPGNKTAKQLLAANIDIAFIVQAVDTNFNLMRLERYVVQILSCHIKPAIILNKSDLAPDIQPFIEGVRSLSRDVDVLVTSTVTRTGLIELMQTIRSGQTCVLIGSSGVGKSSILNELTTAGSRDTAPVSEANQKGRHTTTTRDLFILRNGGILIDTPGMREFGITYEETAGHDLFPAISELAQSCRYSDCRHLDEPGCNVLDHLHTGALAAEVYHSYVKLIKERKRFQIRAEDKRKQQRQFGRMTREATKHRKRNKF